MMVTNYYIFNFMLLMESQKQWAVEKTNFPSHKKKNCIASLLQRIIHYKLDKITQNLY